MKKFLAVIITTGIFFSTLFVQSVFAADFDVSIHLTYSVQEPGSMHITEKRTLTNNSKLYYIKKGSEESFVISTYKNPQSITDDDLQRVADSVIVTDTGGNPVTPDIEVQEDQIVVKVPLTSDLHRGNSQTYTLEYKNYELSEKSGNILNVYVPGIPESYNQIITASNGASTQTEYTVSLKLAKTLDEPTFVVPEPERSTEDPTEYTYVFDPDDLIEHSAWAQIGNTQYYSFVITQAVEPSPSATSKVFNTWYELLLPKETEDGKQKVYFKSISPEPEYITVDGEGNVIGRFAFESNQQREIRVEGFIVTNATPHITQNDVGTLDDIPLQQTYATDGDSRITYQQLLSAQEYWEVQAPEIQQTAEELMRDTTNVYDILLNNYRFVTENVDYDTLKVELLNERKGALSTLKGGSSVCMEYSDLLLTLLRAQGIPTRAAFGYGFDPRSQDAQQEGHQWVEAYLPNVGWVAVDPTWGDTGRRNYIGDDVDHALWYVAGMSVNQPSPVTKYTVGEIGNISSPSVEITVVDSIKLDEVTPLSEVLDTYAYSSKHSVQEKVDQLNIYGKVLFLGIPALLILLILFTVIISVINKIRSNRKRNFVHAEPASHDVPPQNPYY